MWTRFVALPFLAAIPGAILLAAAQTPEQVTFFEKKVRPVLVNRCYGCHSAETKPAGDLRVDDRNGLLRGGNSGPAVVPGDPAKSLLLQRIQHTDPKKRMPKEGALLTDAETADLTAWIKDGLAWPQEVHSEFHWSYTSVVRKTESEPLGLAAFDQSEVATNDQYHMGIE